MEVPCYKCQETYRIVLAIHSLTGRHYMEAGSKNAENTVRGSSRSGERAINCIVRETAEEGGFPEEYARENIREEAGGDLCDDASETQFVCCVSSG